MAVSQLSLKQASLQDAELSDFLDCQMGRVSCEIDNAPAKKREKSGKMQQNPQSITYMITSHRSIVEFFVFLSTIGGVIAACVTLR